jgi:hypothetical protein
LAYWEKIAQREANKYGIYSLFGYLLCEYTELKQRVDALEKKSCASSGPDTVPITASDGHATEPVVPQNPAENAES